MSNIVPMADIQKMAQVAADSKMFGFKNQAEAMAIMLLCQAEDMHPAIAMRDYHVIQGRPALKSDAMLARFQTSGGKVNWTNYTDEVVTGIFSHPQGGEVSITWNMEMAHRLGFNKKENWRNYPRAMMRARCISEGIRTVFPACVAGVYTPEEVQDFSPPKGAKVVDVTPEPEPVPDYAVHLFKPDGTIYASFENEADAYQAYYKVVDSIAANARIPEDEKLEKLRAFKQANMGWMEPETQEEPAE
jgi:acetone carboxylase gamma subunit